MLYPVELRARSAHYRTAPRCETESMNHGAENINKEVEVKLHWRGTATEARAHIEAAGYSVSEARALQVDQLFDRGDRELRNTGQTLRLRQAANKAIVTYKGPAESSRYKEREEIEFIVDSAENVQTVLSRLGYQPGFRYEKVRTTFTNKDAAGLITLDETPIGVYLELEGPGDWIDQTAQTLGFGVEQYVTDSYAVLYRNYRAKNPTAPPDMIFNDGEQHSTLKK